MSDNEDLSAYEAELAGASAAYDEAQPYVRSDKVNHAREVFAGLNDVYPHIIDDIVAVINDGGVPAVQYTNTSSGASVEAHMHGVKELHIVLQAGEGKQFITIEVAG